MCVSNVTIRCLPTHAASQAPAHTHTHTFTQTGRDRWKDMEKQESWDFGWHRRTGMRRLRLCRKARGCCCHNHSVCKVCVGDWESECVCVCVTERKRAEESVICIWMCIYRSFSSVSLVTGCDWDCSAERGRRMRQKEKPWRLLMRL